MGRPERLKYFLFQRGGPATGKNTRGILLGGLRPNITRSEKNGNLRKVDLQDSPPTFR
jgi:hypothetical protein